MPLASSKCEHPHTHTQNVAHKVTQINLQIKQTTWPEVPTRDNSAFPLPPRALPHTINGENRRMTFNSASNEHKAMWRISFCVQLNATPKEGSRELAEGMEIMKN